MIIILMGVSGSGKSTVGHELSKELKWQFVDADDLHPAENVEKMLKGIPLDDQDRHPWLMLIHQLMKKTHLENSNIIIACSALKKSYRHILVHGNKHCDCTIETNLTDTNTLSINTTSTTNFINFATNANTHNSIISSNLSPADAETPIAVDVVNIKENPNNTSTPVKITTGAKDTITNEKDKRVELLSKSVIFVHLHGSMDLIKKRLSKRSGHFMPPALLQSQFDTLELISKNNTDYDNKNNDDNNGNDSKEINDKDDQVAYLCLNVTDAPHEIALKIVNHVMVERSLK